MRELHVYLENTKVAEITADADQRFVINFTAGIAHDTQQQILDLISRPSDKTIKEALESKGFKAYAKAEIPSGQLLQEQSEVTPEETRIASFIHESNLIERLDEMPYDQILARVHQHDENGCVGAWKYAEMLAQHKLPLKMEHALDMHRMVIDEQAALGHFIETKYRGQKRDVLVMIGGKTVKVPTKKELQSFFDNLNAGIENITGKEDEVLKFASQNHLEFEAMHPFIDGNGRIGRYIANYILKYFDLPVLVFTSHDKNLYYDAFQEDNVTKMHEYFLRKFHQK